MKRQILLLEESVTVQKVVALTLDQNLYTVLYAKTRSEAMKLISEHNFSLILVSEQVGDLNVASFPQEVESWLKAPTTTPPIVLITTQDIHEANSYAGVLRKPFSPQNLQDLVASLCKETESHTESGGEEFEAKRLENVFNKTFADEAELVRETLDESHNEVKQPPANDPQLWQTPQGPVEPTGMPTQPVAPPTQQAPNQNLWNAHHHAPQHTQQPNPQYAPPQQPQAPPQSASFSHPPFSPPPQAPVVHTPAPTQTAPTAPTGPVPESELEKRIDMLLNRIVPPIVERMVKERLDALLSESSVKDPLADIKP